MTNGLLKLTLIALSILTTALTSTALAVAPGQLSAGSSHSVALKGDGTVWAWGANSSGQLGNGLTTDSPVPVQSKSSTGNLSGCSRVAAGAFHSVALKSDGTVWTWGSNDYGQLGTGTYVSRTTAGTVSGLTGVVTAIAAGNSHTVVVKQDGTVWAWGDNTYGQLGNGTTATSNSPVQVTGLTGKIIVAVAAGLHHTVAIQDDGTVWSWGRNIYGQLGDGSKNNSSVPVTVATITGVRAVAAGWYHTVALLNDGTVACWGRNAFGQLGTGSLTDSTIPLLVPGLSQVTAIAAGYYNSVAVAGGGTVWTWGINESGQLGTGTRSNSNTPVQAGSLTAVTMVAAGVGHTEALKTDGTIWVWGKNLNGQFGNGTSSRSKVPLPIGSLTGVTEIAAGRDHSLALLGISTMNGWGLNSAGQLGNGTLTDSSVPLSAFADLTTNKVVTRLAAGDSHTTALTIDGQVWTSGANQYGQLGNGTTGASNIPVQVNITNVTAVASGSNHSLALKSDGTVWAWGYNNSRQVDNTQLNRTTPVQVSGLPAITAIAAGGDRSVALATDGSVWYWGRIDQNNVVGPLTPQQMSGLTGVVTAIAAGSFHTLALKSDGTVWAWGTNNYGELGSGTVGTGSSTPRQVGSLTGVTAIAAAGWHNLAVKSDRTVWAWGINDYGQLGNGTLTSSVNQVAVTGLTGITAVAAGPNHSLARTGSGTVYAWGSNEYGQLGNGAVTTLPQQATINLDTVPPVDGTLTAIPGNGQVYLTWSGFSDPWSGISGYKLVYATGATAPASCSTGTTIYTGTNTSFTHSGLTNGTNYSYRLCAIDNATNVSSGVTTTATPLASLALVISTTSPLPAGTVGAVYSQTFQVTGGTPGYSWYLTAGSSLPANLALSQAGLLNGIPQTAGSFNFTVMAIDSAARSATKDFSLTVNKATPNITAWPTASAITYGQTLASSTLTGGTAAPSGTFAWTTPATAPGVGTASQSVTFNPADSANYATVTGTVSVTVNKATPSVTAWPTASAITYGQTLASSTLTGGTATPSGTFSWTTPATAPAAGTAAYSVTFTPTDAANYATVTGTVTITVNKATPSVTAWPTASAITYGQTLASSALTGGTVTPSGTFAWTTPATAPAAGTAAYSVTFTPTDAANYATVTGTVSVTVNKATPSVTAWPTASAITYGQTLASSTLTGGTATPSGTFAWTTPATAPGVGTASQSVTFNPADSTNYVTVTGTVSVTVNKATPSVTAWPTASAITYGQTLASSTLTGGTATPSGTFSWTTPATAPATGTAPYSVTFTPTDAANYATVTGTVSVTVNKATPSVTAWPTASAIAYGQTLASSALTGGSATPSGTFAWTTPATAPGVGTASQSVTFNPADSTNYATVTGTVSVTVNKATPSVTAWPTASAITYGQTLASSTLTGGTTAPSGTFAWTTPATAPAAGTAPYSVTFTPTDAANYATVTGTVSVTVNKATPSVTAWPSASAITYGQTLASSTLTGGTSTPSGIFTWTTPATAPAAGTASQSVTFNPIDSTNYATVTGTVSVTVNKATPSVTAWPTASAITYGQTLASSTLTGGTVTPSGTFAWTTPATAPAAGTAPYSVTFTPTDAANYATVTGTVTITVNKATPSVNAWPTASAIAYGQTLASSTLTGGTTAPSGTFAWTTPATAPAAGTAPYSVTFTPADSTNYATVTGTVSVTVNITPIYLQGAIPPYFSTLTDAYTAASAVDTIRALGVLLSEPVVAFNLPKNITVKGGYNDQFTAQTGMTTIRGVITIAQGTVVMDRIIITGTGNDTVNKVTPNITAWPTASTITYGETLAASTLTGGAATPSGTFTWTTPATAPSAGTDSYSVTFTPTDAANYVTVTGTVSVTVNKAMPVVSAWPTASAIAYSQTLASSTLTGGTATPSGTFAWTTPATAPGVGTASQSVMFIPDDSANYTPVTGSVSIEVVNKAIPSVTAWPTASAIIFGQTLASSTLIGGSATPSGTFAWTTPATVPTAGTAAYSVTFTPTDASSYITVTGTVGVTVNTIYLQGANQPYFSTLTDAYTAASAVDTIRALGVFLSEPVVAFNLPKNITVKGGYADQFTGQTGMTTIRGVITIAQGTVVMDRIIIR